VAAPYHANLSLAFIAFYVFPDWTTYFESRNLSYRDTQRCKRLSLTGLDDRGLLGELDGTRAGANALKSLDNLHGLVISDLAKDDVAAIEPGGDDGGDEELRAVGVGTSVGHGEETGASVLQGEVLIGELLAVDGLATSAVATGEVTTLEHELGDDAVERGSLVAEALLAGAESAEVLGSLRDLVVVEVEVDATSLGARLVLPLQIEENLVTHGCVCCGKESSCTECSLLESELLRKRRRSRDS
jgi:hypothetical protein